MTLTDLDQFVVLGHLDGLAKKGIVLQVEICDCGQVLDYGPSERTFGLRRGVCEECSKAQRLRSRGRGNNQGRI